MPKPVTGGEASSVPKTTEVLRNEVAHRGESSCRFLQLQLRERESEVSAPTCPHVAPRLDLATHRLVRAEIDKEKGGCQLGLVIRIERGRGRTPSVPLARARANRSSEMSRSSNAQRRDAPEDGSGEEGVLRVADEAVLMKTASDIPT